MHPPLSVLRITRWRDERSEAAKRMSTPHLIPPRTPATERESPTAPGLPAPSSRPPSSLRSSCAAGATRTGHVVPRSCGGDRYSLVSRETNEHRPLPLTRPVLLSCPRSERSLSVHSPRLPPTQNETQNTLPDRPIPLTPTRPGSTFIPVSKEHGPPTERNRP